MKLLMYFAAPVRDGQNIIYVVWGFVYSTTSMKWWKMIDWNAKVDLYSAEQFHACVEICAVARSELKEN